MLLLAAPMGRGPNWAGAGLVKVASNGRASESQWRAAGLGGASWAGAQHTPAHSPGRAGPPKRPRSSRIRAQRHHLPSGASRASAGARRGRHGGRRVSLRAAAPRGHLTPPVSAPPVAAWKPPCRGGGLPPLYRAACMLTCPSGCPLAACRCHGFRCKQKAADCSPPVLKWVAVIITQRPPRASQLCLQWPQSHRSSASQGHVLGLKPAMRRERGAGVRRPRAGVAAAFLRAMRNSHTPGTGAPGAEAPAKQNSAQPQGPVGAGILVNGYEGRGQCWRRARVRAGAAACAASGLHHTGCTVLNVEPWEDA